LPQRLWDGALSLRLTPDRKLRGFGWHQIRQPRYDPGQLWNEEVHQPLKPQSPIPQTADDQDRTGGAGPSPRGVRAQRRQPLLPACASLLHAPRHPPLHGARCAMAPHRPPSRLGRKDGPPRDAGVNLPPRPAARSAPRGGCCAHRRHVARHRSRSPFNP